MAKKRKYPKKPTAKASVQTLKNYIARCKEVDKYNAQLEKDKKEKAKLRAQISRM